MMRNVLLLVLLALTGKVAAASAGGGDPLDTTKVKALYLAGDFDQDIKWIASRFESPTPITHVDSAFGLKYLGVMRAANDQTWEKGKNDLRRMLALDPSATIDALGASDRINAMFHDLQLEAKVPPHPLPAAANQTASAGNMTPADSAATAASQAQARNPHAAGSETTQRPSRTWMWVAGGAGTVALGTALVLWVSSGGTSIVTQSIKVGN